MKEILLFSGGLDSFIAWWYLNKPECLYVHLGHWYALKERDAVRKLESKIPELKVNMEEGLNLGRFEEEDAFIPLRNSFLANMGALYGDKIWIVVQKGETNIPDRTSEFFEATTKALTAASGEEKKVDSPFWDLTKTEMVGWYLEQGYDPKLLKYTRSCYTSCRCGRCPACFRRWVSMSLNGIEEDYCIAPWTTDLAEEYKEKGENGYYCKERNEEILTALNKAEG